MVPPPRPPIRQDRPSPALALTGDSCPVVLDLPVRLLVVTRTVLGSGNYLNARLTMEGLCRTIPHIRIDWVVAHDGDTLPRTVPLPPQVTCYETDALWKLFPVIRALSLDAQLICSFPNFFLIDAEKKFLPLTLSDSVTSRFIMLNEYNSTYAPEEVPPYYLSLNSGVNAGVGSLGLIKPAPLCTAGSLAEKRALLLLDEKAKKIFSTNPEAPLYFAYGYLPKKDGHSSIVGMRIVDFFALFIEHAKRSGHSSIKIVMPIDPDTIARSEGDLSQYFGGLRHRL